MCTLVPNVARNIQSLQHHRNTTVFVKSRLVIMMLFHEKIMRYELAWPSRGLLGFTTFVWWCMWTSAITKMWPRVSATLSSWWDGVGVDLLLLLACLGPCPPCPVTVMVTCYCGNSSPVARRCGAKGWACTRICRKLLACGNHICELICHSGMCRLINSSR